RGPRPWTSSREFLPTKRGHFICTERGVIAVMRCFSSAARRLAEASSGAACVVPQQAAAVRAVAGTRKSRRARVMAAILEKRGPRDRYLTPAVGGRQGFAPSGWEAPQMLAKSPLAPGSERLMPERPLRLAANRLVT